MESIFDNIANGRRRVLKLKNADCWYDPVFIQKDEALSLQQYILQNVPFRQDEIMMFGKPVMQPREVCWMADAGLAIKYSGLRLEPSPWDEKILKLKEKIEATTNTRFNSVLINHYRNGQDSMGWHADNEPELGPDPYIASISLGAEREFQIKSSDELLKIILENGSLLCMGSGSQQYYKHQLPKRKLLNISRVNLTFRLMLKSA